MPQAFPRICAPCEPPQARRRMEALSSGRLPGKQTVPYTYRFGFARYAFTRILSETLTLGSLAGGHRRLPTGLDSINWQFYASVWAYFSFFVKNDAFKVKKYKKPLDELGIL